METQARYVLIGFFSLLIVAAAMLAILWTGKVQVDQEYVYYETSFNEVTGLNTGSDVRYQGVPVGQVSRIRIDRERPTEVLVTLQIVVNDDIVILDTTTASLEQQGLTGVGFIQLTNPPTSGNPLPRVFDPNADHPAIPSVQSSLQSLFSSAPRLLSNADRLITDLRGVVDEENRKQIAAILENIATLTGALARREAEIEEILRNSAVLTANAAETATAVTALAKDLQGLSDTADQLLKSDVAAAIRQVTATGKSFEDVGDQVAALVAENRDGISTFTNQGLAQVGLFVAEARELVRTLERLAARLESDPSELLFGGTKPVEVEAKD